MLSFKCCSNDILRISRLMIIILLFDMFAVTKV